MPALKCPNTSCTFLFDPSKVPAGAMLACPLCRTRFKLDAATAATEPAFSNLVSKNETKVVPRSFWNSNLPIYGLVALIVVGLGVFLIAIIKGKREPIPEIEEQMFQDHSVAIRPPIEPWQRDRDLENRLLINLGVYKRTEPDAWFGYAAKKYETHNARKSEMVSFLDGRLKMLCENVNKEEIEGETWLNQPVVKYTFRGTDKREIIIAGECLAVSIKGIAYFFFAWAPERDIAVVSPDFEAAKKQIRMLTNRENWKETKPPGTVFKSQKLDYKLMDMEGLWQIPKNLLPTDEDPVADLLVRGEIIPKGQRADTKYKADLVAFVLPSSTDASKAALEFVKTRKSRNPEMYMEFVFEEIKAPVTGDDPIGEPPAELIPTIRLKMTHPKSPDSASLIVVSAIESNGKVIAVEATCLWKERTIWEKRLVNLAGSLQSTEAK